MSTWQERLEHDLGIDSPEGVERLVDLLQGEPDPEVVRMLDDLFSGRAQCVRGPQPAE